MVKTTDKSALKQIITVDDFWTVFLSKDIFLLFIIGALALCLNMSYFKEFWVCWMALIILAVAKACTYFCARKKRRKDPAKVVDNPSKKGTKESIKERTEERTGEKKSTPGSPAKTLHLHYCILLPIPLAEDVCPEFGWLGILLCSRTGRGPGCSGGRRPQAASSTGQRRCTSSGGGGKASAQGRPLRPGKKRLMGEDNNDSPSDYSDAKPSAKRGRRERFACHFFKLNPRKHWRCSMRAYKEPRHLKDHIYSRHSQPEFYCPICFRNFNSRSDCDEHIIQPLRACQQVPSPFDDQINRDVVNSLQRQSSKGIGAYEGWYQIWEILFPGVQRPSSPYIDPEHPFQVIAEGFIDSLRRLSFLSHLGEMEWRMVMAMLDIPDQEYNLPSQGTIQMPDGMAGSTQTASDLVTVPSLNYTHPPTSDDNNRAGYALASGGATRSENIRTISTQPMNFHPTITPATSTIPSENVARTSNQYDSMTPLPTYREPLRDMQGNQHDIRYPLPTSSIASGIDNGQRHGQSHNQTGQESNGIGSEYFQNLPGYIYVGPWTGYTADGTVVVHPGQWTGAEGVPGTPTDPPENP
jgi:hypothetical protein